MVSIDKGGVVFFLQFLQDQLETTDDVSRAFIEHMLPAMMEHYAVCSAKGGDHTQHARLDEETKRKFAEKADQSMMSHQLNGIFPVMRLLNILESEHLGRVPFTEVERQVYILSYLMHDVDKIADVRDVPTKSRTDIERTKDLIAEELRKCNVAAFFPDYAAYLEDIAFLVVNTQEKHGTHLNTFLWQLQLPERRISLLRSLCTYSDLIAYLIASPAAILTDEARRLTSILSELSDNQLVFSYHQLREVRGLLTNVINNGLVHLFIEGREGIWPYLFFSDGVVYIKRKSLQFALTTEQIVDAVRKQLREICAERVRTTAPGFKFSIQGIAKHPGYYFEFLSLEEYATLLARYLTVIFVTMLGMLDKKQNSLREQVTERVIEHLGLQAYWAQAQTIPNKGGVEYRWFWLGACYLRDHPGITEYEGEGNLLDTFNSTFQFIIKLAGEELRKQMPQKYLSHLTSHLDSIVEVPATMRAGGVLPDFQGELARYAGAKSKGRKLICTLCNSAYPTEEQEDNAVLFQPWVYKNKLSLYAGKNAGGVCAICSLELMLRQILQKGQLRLTGSKFEALKTKYLAVYPNFFFTAETGAMVQGILDQLQDINFFTVRRQLERRDITIGELLKLEAFAAPNINQSKPYIYVDEEEGKEDED